MSGTPQSGRYDFNKHTQLSRSKNLYSGLSLFCNRQVNHINRTNNRVCFTFTDLITKIGFSNIALTQTIDLRPVTDQTRPMPTRWRGFVCAGVLGYAAR